MKCVARVKRYSMDGYPLHSTDGEPPDVRRVSNGKAQDMVRSKRWMYVDKQTWKRNGRP